MLTGSLEQSPTDATPPAPLPLSAAFRASHAGTKQSDPRASSTRSQPARTRRRPRQQIDVQPVKLFLVQILLHLHKRFPHARLLARRVRQRIAIRSTVIDVYVDVQLLPLGDDAWIEPRHGGQLVP